MAVFAVFNLTISDKGLEKRSGFPKRLLVTKATLGTPFSNMMATQMVIIPREMISVQETFVSNQAIDNDCQMTIHKVMGIHLLITSIHQQKLITRSLQLPY